MHTKVIRKLLYQRCFAANPVLARRVADWFPANEHDRVMRAVEQMVADPDIPLRRATDDAPLRVCLSDIEAALLYLEQHDIVPSGLNTYPTSPIPQ